MSLMCDHEQFHKPSVSFVGQMNDCSYFFEVRTAAACATINQAQVLGPGAVFGAMYIYPHQVLRQILTRI
jgi:cation-dependent mannose-6-phosphate receptor